MKRGILQRIAGLLRLRRNGTRHGGFDTGRDTFVRVAQREQKLKRSLLKKINDYRAQRKRTADVGYAQGTAKPGRWRSGLLVACLLLVAVVFVTGRGPGGLLGLVGRIDAFRVTSVEVNGCRNASLQNVRMAIGGTVNSSLFTVDIEGIGTAVKAADDWIKSTKVVRRWPDTIVIEVVEYEPYALIAVATNERAELYYLDREGTPFLKPGADAELDYPVITGLERLAGVDERMAVLQEPLAFLRLVGANNPNLPAQSISEVHVDTSKGMIIYLVEHPFPIYFGWGEVRQKYVRLRKVLEVLYKPRRTGMDIARVAYIRMDYLKDQVIVGYRES